MNPRSSRRDETGGLGGQYVEGRQAVRELLRAGRRAVRQIYLADPMAASAAVAEIVDLAARAKVPVRRVSREALDGVARTEAPQGVVAVAEAVRATDLPSLSAAVAGTAPPFVVVLDGVTDPHNLGAVMRSALGAGVTGLVVGRHRSARLSPAAVKAAAGAVEHLPVALVPGIAGAVSALSGAGLWTVGLEAEAPTPLWDLPVAGEPLALVLGSEGGGLTPLVRKRCEMTASVPMHGPLGSLNVSAAAAVACFEVARRRVSAGI